jgi:hypothetical protein
VQIAPGLERRLKLVETKGAEVVGRVVQGDADERLAEALAKVPPRLLFKMLALADTADDDAAETMLAGDPELELAIDGLMDLDDA